MISNYVTYHASLARRDDLPRQLPNGATPTRELTDLPTPRRTRAAWVCQGRVNVAESTPIRPQAAADLPFAWPHLHRKVFDELMSGVYPLGLGLRLLRGHWLSCHVNDSTDGFRNGLHASALARA